MSFRALGYFIDTFFQTRGGDPSGWMRSVRLNDVPQQFAHFLNIREVCIGGHIERGRDNLWGQPLSALKRNQTPHLTLHPASQQAK